MSRGGKLAGVMGAFGASLLLSPAASADVLEISGDTAVWVARGASGSRPINDSKQLASLTQSPGETLAAETAGPALWTAHIARLAVRYDLSPSLLEAVVWQESRWNPSARSPKGAVGLTQLMPGTAANLGVNPYDALANLEGGARYLKAMLTQFNGDTRLALAAYNAGPGAVERAGGIPLNGETPSYVRNVLAFWGTK